MVYASATGLRLTIIIVVGSLFVVCSARTGFVKDQSEDLVTFPPYIFDNVDSPVPAGHLRPLGRLIIKVYRTILL